MIQKRCDMHGIKISMGKKIINIINRKGKTLSVINSRWKEVSTQLSENGTYCFTDIKLLQFLDCTFFPMKYDYVLCVFIYGNLPHSCAYIRPALISKVGWEERQIREYLLFIRIGLAVLFFFISANHHIGRRLVHEW